MTEVVLLERPAEGVVLLRINRPEARNALNFEVRFWAARPEVVAELKSDVALGLAAALQQEGITVPIPQRHLHITGLTENDRLEKVLSEEQMMGDGKD